MPKDLYNNRITILENDVKKLEECVYSLEKALNEAINKLDSIYEKEKASKDSQSILSEWFNGEERQ